MSRARNLLSFLFLVFVGICIAGSNNYQRNPAYGSSPAFRYGQGNEEEDHKCSTYIRKTFFEREMHMYPCYRPMPGVTPIIAHQTSIGLVCKGYSVVPNVRLIRINVCCPGWRLDNRGRCTIRTGGPVPTEAAGTNDLPKKTTASKRPYKSLEDLEKYPSSYEKRVYEPSRRLSPGELLVQRMKKMMERRRQFMQAIERTVQEQRNRQWRPSPESPVSSVIPPVRKFIMITKTYRLPHPVPPPTQPPQTPQVPNAQQTSQHMAVPTAASFPQIPKPQRKRPHLIISQTRAFIPKSLRKQIKRPEPRQNFQVPQTEQPFIPQMQAIPNIPQIPQTPDFQRPQVPQNPDFQRPQVPQMPQNPDFQRPQMQQMPQNLDFQRPQMPQNPTFQRPNFTPNNPLLMVQQQMQQQMQQQAFSPMFQQRLHMQHQMQNPNFVQQISQNTPFQPQIQQPQMYVEPQIEMRPDVQQQSFNPFPGVHLPQLPIEIPPVDIQPGPNSQMGMELDCHMPSPPPCFAGYLNVVKMCFGNANVEMPPDDVILNGDYNFDGVCKKKKEITFCIMTRTRPCDNMQEQLLVKTSLFNTLSEIERICHIDSIKGIEDRMNGGRAKQIEDKIASLQNHLNGDQGHDHSHDFVEPEPKPEPVGTGIVGTPIKIQVPLQKIATPVVIKDKKVPELKSDNTKLKDIVAEIEANQLESKKKQKTSDNLAHAHPHVQELEEEVMHEYYLPLLIGTAIGIVAIIILLLALLCICCRRRIKKKMYLSKEPEKPRLFDGIYTIGVPPPIYEVNGIPPLSYEEAKGEKITGSPSSVRRHNAENAEAEESTTRKGVVTDI